MHRVRQSLPYFEKFGWKPLVLSVKPEYVEGKQDALLAETVPAHIRNIKIKAFSTRWTRKLGLGSLALRSLWFYKQAGNALLRKQKVDLVYFSTTMFPVMILGNYWKKKFNVPYVIDMQDPWHSDHYLKLPKHQQPQKFWFSYRLNKTLEPIAMRAVSGIVTVSQGYCTMLQERYPNIVPENCTVIPFGAFEKDFEILSRHSVVNRFFRPNTSWINIAYVGRGGYDMAFSAKALFTALAKGIDEHPALFSKVRLHFIGTSYATDGKGKPSFAPLAQICGVKDLVKEYTDRVPYFEALQILKDADMLIIPGSTDPNYTASKLYPYIMANKPLLTVFNKQSSVIRILAETGAGEAATFTDTTQAEILASEVYHKWVAMLEKLPFRPQTNWQAFESYTAREMTRKQVAFFDHVVVQKFEKLS
jgi:glycosyltransferase involved in cell wall biosynthesis